DDFAEALVRHPVLTHLVRGLLWGAYDVNHRLLFAFRVSAEGDYCDLRDETLELPSDSVVGLVHPALLTPEEIDDCAMGLARYEVFQPFAQLTRPVHALEPDEQEQRVLQRYGDRMLSGPVVANMLDKPGWNRRQPTPPCYVRHFPGADTTVVLRLAGWEE